MTDNRATATTGGMETRAAYITEVGGADVIRYGVLPVPAIGPTDVLIRTEALAANQARKRAPAA